MQLPINVKRKYYILSISFLILIFYAYYFSLRVQVKNVVKDIQLKNIPKRPGNSKKTAVQTAKVSLKHVVVHIDLKRTPLKLSYLKQLLLIMTQLGATGLLMEYEDMFPYEGELTELRNPNSYSKIELTEFLKVCKEYNLEVIPLVQTFSHLQNVLQLNKFRHLREVDDHQDTICPTKPESLHLIKNMLTQVIRFHASVAPVMHVHIGCDEVFQINKCSECRRRHLNDSNIYIQHVRTVISIVKNISQHSNVLIWDDMLSTIPFSPENTTAEPVMWNYKRSFDVSNKDLSKYHKVFPNIWIASAFKGADGNENVLPNMTNRFLNNYSWINKIRDYKFKGESKVFNFEGIILTGWSRYQYDKPTVDILPVSLPSLILNLLLVSSFKTGYVVVLAKDPTVFYTTYLHRNFLTLLNCDTIDVKLNNAESANILDFDSLFLGYCNFNEWKMYKGIKEYSELYLYIKKVSEQIITLDKKFCDQVTDKIYNSNSTLFHLMNKYYATDFVTEYVNYLILKLNINKVVCHR